jgi:5-formyltetrahydrofolate cyclo-ligase
MLLDSRAAASPQDHTADADALTTALQALALPRIVCAYVPFGNEPGSLTMLDAVISAHVEVRLPVIASGTRVGPMWWGRYGGAGTLTAGRFGIPVPVGERLPPEAIGEAGLVLVPALAVDRRGVRLGRGAGFYDRTLPFADPAARLVAVVRDSEIVEELPEEPHDRRMNAALTPGKGLIPLE